MPKVMFFIDGTWLYANAGRLAGSYGDEDFKIDFGKLPGVLAEEVAAQIGEIELDMVRTCLFGSYAKNHDLRDDGAVRRRLDFFSMLKEEYHYELELFPVNFMGRRLRRVDRDAHDVFEPREKCVDIALATSMLYFAAIPYAYDIAVAVIGDQDFKPVLQHVRRLGKRVAIASIRGSCSPDYADPRDEARVKDYDIIWLDDLLQKLELRWDRHQLMCAAPQHRGPNPVWTTFHPRKGQRFFCGDCKSEFERPFQAAASGQVAASVNGGDAADADADPAGTARRLQGVVDRIGDHGYGFIRTEDGRRFYFNAGDLIVGGFGDYPVGRAVSFRVLREPTAEKAGAATQVGPAGDAENAPQNDVAAPA